MSTRGVISGAYLKVSGEMTEKLAQKIYLSGKTSLRASILWFVEHILPYF